MVTLEEFKERYYKAFFNKEIIESAYDSIIFESKKRLENIDKELETAQHNLEIRNNKNEDKETLLRDYQQYATRDGFIKINNTFIEYYTELKEFNLLALDNLDSDKRYKDLSLYRCYKKYVDYFVKGKPLKLDNDGTGFLDFFCYYFKDVLEKVAYLVLNNQSEINNGIKEEAKLRVMLNSNFIVTGFHREFLNYLKQTANGQDIFKEFDFNFYCNFIDYLLEVFDRQEKESDKIGEYVDDEEIHVKKTFEQLSLKLEYNDKATLTETSVINDLAEISLDDKALRDLQILKNTKFNLTNESIEESEKELGKLTELDRFVLDTIVLDFYFKQDLKVFSDRQIAIQYSKEKGGEWNSEEIRKQINDGILKLQNIRLHLDYNSIKELKKENIKVKQNNPLIWLESIEVDSDTSSNYYKIIQAPFFLTYLMKTNSKMITYDRGLLYKQIKGMDNSDKNQALKHYLIRRISVMVEELPTDIYISTEDIYRVQDINANTYPKDTNLRKAKQLARERTELVLDELKKEYRFTYSQDNKNKRIKGYYIKPKKN